MGGNVSKKVANKITRPIKNINIDNRAQKAIEKNKNNPKPSPRHSSTVELYKQQAADNPDIHKELERQDESLISRVNKMNLEVQDNQPKIITPLNRPLPQGKAPIMDAMQSFYHPRKIPEGKLSLVQVVELVNKHQNSPKEFTPENLAETYKVDLFQVKQVLLNFRHVDVNNYEEVGKTTADSLELNSSFSERWSKFTLFKKSNEEKKAKREANKTQVEGHASDKTTDKQGV